MQTAVEELKAFKEMGIYKEILNEDFEVAFKEMVGYIQSLYPKMNVNKNN